MNEFSTDDEQLEQLKRFWKENGTSIILGVAIALAGVSIWQYWDNATRTTGETASAKYQEILDIANKNQGIEPLAEADMQNIAFTASSLKDEFADTTYAQFAALMLAKQAVEQNDLDSAEKELRWILDQSQMKSITVTAQLRLAQVLAAKQEAEDALDLLDDLTSAAHQASIEELKGDIYLQLGQNDNAKTAYQNAIEILENEENLNSRPLLQLKLDDLAGDSVAQINSNLVEVIEPEVTPVDNDIESNESINAPADINVDTSASEATPTDVSTSLDNTETLPTDVNLSNDSDEAAVINSDGDNKAFEIPPVDVIIDASGDVDDESISSPTDDNPVPDELFKSTDDNQVPEELFDPTGE